MTPSGGNDDDDDHPSDNHVQKPSKVSHPIKGGKRQRKRKRYQQKEGGSVREAEKRGRRGGSGANETR